MPCCHVGLTGPFANQFTSDAQRFSAYVGGALNLPPGAAGPELISALHVDLKLWQPARVPIGRPYRINDAFGNAWKAARPLLNPDPFAGHPGDRQEVENAVFDLPQPPEGCVLSVFDQWILDTIEAIRVRSLNLAGGGAPAQPYALSTIGMAQKILNLFLKYQACWHVGGQWDQAPGQFVNHPASARVAPFLCALHSPIDSRLLNALLGSPIGQELVRLGWMNNQGYLQQANGVFTSWSNLDCLKTYFRFQLMLRKIAMRTWPPGCACQLAANHGNNSAAASNLPPGIFEPDEVWDWLRRLADVCGDDIIWPEKNDKPGDVCSNDKKGVKIDDMPGDFLSDDKKYPKLGVMTKRIVYIDKQKDFWSLKWCCHDRYNAGAISFKRRGFLGSCYVNSRISHAGGDRALWEEIELMGGNFRLAPGFHNAPAHGGVAEIGGGNRYLGYRDFTSQNAAIAYLSQWLTVRYCK